MIHQRTTNDLPVAAGSLLLASLLWPNIAGVTANEPDYCAAVPSVYDASKECTSQSCLCRLQAARQDGPNLQDYTSIEDGCFRAQSCPDLVNELTVSEEIQCRIDVSGELSFSTTGVSFDGGPNAFENNEYAPDTSGSGAVFTFPSGLHAGQEISIRYNAAGETDLAMGFGIGCDGYIYFLADNDSAGDYTCSVDNVGDYCSSSCSQCSMCSPSTNTRPDRAGGFIYYTKSFMKVDQFNQGTILAGVAYYDDDSDVVCTSGSDYLLCSGKTDRTLITAECGLKSALSTNGGGGGTTGGGNPSGGQGGGGNNTSGGGHAVNVFFAAALAGFLAPALALLWI